MFLPRLSHLATVFTTLAVVGTVPLAAIAQNGETPPAVGDTRKPDPTPVVPAKGQAPAGLALLSHGPYFSPHAMVFDKANRTLSVWKTADEEVSFVTAVPADFGRNSGDKSSSGDFKTPEGIYFFQQFKEKAELDFERFGMHDVKAFTLDYPNLFDTLEDKSGSGIWLHSIPDQLSLWRGSRGCVVVRNEVLKDLSQYITPKRTPFLIEDSVKFVPGDELKQTRKQWQDWLDRWVESWQSKNLDSYMSHYSADFKSMNMNQSQWKTYKKGLAEKYAFIKVKTSEPVVLVHREKVVIRFLQDYKSDKNADYGEKTLYIKKDADQNYRIIAEEWSAIPRDGIVATH